MNKKLILIIFILILAGISFYFYNKNVSDSIVAKAGFPGCKLDGVCGDLIGIDCGAATDGPFLYVNKITNKEISACGGAMMIPDISGTRIRDECPPKEWKCPISRAGS